MRVVAAERDVVDHVLVAAKNLQRVERGRLFRRREHVKQRHVKIIGARKQAALDQRRPAETKALLRVALETQLRQALRVRRLARVLGAVKDENVRQRRVAREHVRVLINENKTPGKSATW